MSYIRKLNFTGNKKLSTMGSIAASNSTATGTGDLPKIFGTTRVSDGSALDSLHGLGSTGDKTNHSL
jgi:hypothetical protein